MKVHLGQMLKQEGLIDDAQLLSALAYQRNWGGRLGSAVINLRFLSEQQLLAAVGRQLGVPLVNIGSRRISREVIDRLPAKLIHRRHVMPLEIVPSGRTPKLIVAFCAPEDLFVIDEVSFAAGMAVQPVLASEGDILAAIARNVDTPTHGSPRPRADVRSLDLPAEPEEPFEVVFGHYVER